MLLNWFMCGFESRLGHDAAMRRARKERRVKYTVTEIRDGRPIETHQMPSFAPVEDTIFYVIREEVGDAYTDEEMLAMTRRLRLKLWFMPCASIAIGRETVVVRRGWCR